ncbi:MAG TPA: PcfJ domain-containing protein [Armatimonadota bacterium]|jgi:hypothetical protein
MPAELAERPAEERARLLSALEVMQQTRELTGKGSLTTTIFHTEGVGDWGDAPPYCRSVAFACRLCRTPESREAFQHLLGHVEPRAGKLLHDACPDGQHNYLLPLLQLAERHALWRRPPEEWRPHSGKADRQFAHLLRTLLTEEERERFGREVFPEESSTLARLWFGHLAFDPHRPAAQRPALSLTRRMRFHFLTAPATYDYVRALRYAQVKGLGGSTALARAVDFSRLAWQLWPPEDEEWWTGVLQWFANHPELDLEQVIPIIDFLYARRYGEAAAEIPPDPAFQVKGREPEPLLALVQDWHEELALRKETVHTEFPPSGLKPGSWTLERDGITRVWTVTEITDSTALRDEARKMHHCVASYQENVEKGKFSLWSMRSRRGHIVKRATTIQVNHSGHRITQCRGACNRQPRPEEKRILRMWAQQNSLTLAL